MKKFVSALVLSAGIAASANAASTNLVFEASVNGGAYATGLQVVQPGDQVRVQMRVQLSNVADANGAAVSMTATGGLSGIAGFVNAANWADESLAAWSPTQGQLPTFDYPVGGPGAYTGDPATALGRVAPFGSAGALENPTSNVSGGTLTLGNTFGPGGIMSIGQLGGPQSLDENFDNFFVQGLDVVVFRFAFSVGSAGLTDRTIDVGMSNILNNRGIWYRSAASATAVQNVLMGSISNAQLQIQAIPTPASLALLGLGGLVAGRRRRN
ncbi:MAG: hypothetical protein AB7Q00_00945 [Phycisphaerales bacterium]